MIVQDVLNKAIVQIGDMRAKTEEMKWDNMRRAVCEFLIYLNHNRMSALMNGFR